MLLHLMLLTINVWLNESSLNRITAWQFDVQGKPSLFIDVDINNVGPADMSLSFFSRAKDYKNVI